MSTSPVYQQGSWTALPFMPSLCLQDDVGNALADRVDRCVNALLHFALPSITFLPTNIEQSAFNCPFRNAIQTVQGQQDRDICNDSLIRPRRKSLRSLPEIPSNQK